MPSVDELDAALAVADADLLPVSQGHALRRATRGQLLAGMQTSLAVSPGQILGRSSDGVGAPEPVSIGDHLVLQAGTLSAVTTPLDVASLPTGAVPTVSDLVPFGQGGRNVSLSYGAFMGGVASLGSLDFSRGLVMPCGAHTERSLADTLGDSVAVEFFGAKGDGTTDDTAAFAAATASGLPIRLGAKTYVVNGQFTIARADVVMIGVAGRTVVRRGVQAGNGAWIAVQADRFAAEGIIFDANGPAVGVESWGVFVANQCLHSEFYRCSFRNSFGASLGSGLVFQSSYPAVCQHAIRDCDFNGNAAHGVWVQACVGVLISSCRAFGNTGFGIVVDYNDSSFVKKARLNQVVNNRCWNNQRGISVGNYNATNLEPATWGNANPDAIAILVMGNVCHDNVYYGIAISGASIAVQGNVLTGNGIGTTGGAGVLANAAHCAVVANTISGAAVYGIDCGGSVSLDVMCNSIMGPLFGINCGGGQSVRVSGNRLQACTTFGVSVNNIETDGNGVNFGMATSGIIVANNWIEMDGGAGGIWLRDGPRLVEVRGNRFTGTGLVGNCLWADTDSITVHDNQYNSEARVTCNPSVGGGLQQIVFPDIADSLAITSAPAGVQAMISSRQAQLMGRISFVRITSGGSGYGNATISIGGAGTGATARAVISDGAVIGAVVTSPGGSYGPVGTVVPVTIAGDGSGATGVAFAAPPLPDERRISIRCDSAVRFATAGAIPTQINWTGADLQMPAGSEVTWNAIAGGWSASSFSPGFILGATVQHVDGTGTAGCTSGVGRGSPAGVVVAPPGSDWRNLDGGVGSTYWIKQSGTEADGWVALA